MIVYMVYAETLIILFKLFARCQLLFIHNIFAKPKIELIKLNVGMVII